MNHSGHLNRNQVDESSSSILYVQPKSSSEASDAHVSISVNKIPTMAIRKSFFGRSKTIRGTFDCITEGEANYCYTFHAQPSYPRIPACQKDPDIAILSNHTSWKKEPLFEHAKGMTSRDSNNTPTQPLGVSDVQQVKSEWSGYGSAIFQSTLVPDSRAEECFEIPTHCEPQLAENSQPQSNEDPAHRNSCRSPQRLKSSILKKSVLGQNALARSPVARRVTFDTKKRVLHYKQKV